MHDCVDEQFGQLDERSGRRVAAVDLGGLSGHRLFDDRMPVTVQDRAPGAHQIDVLAVVDIPKVAAAGSFDEHRGTAPQHGRIRMAVDPSWDDPLSSCLSRPHQLGQQRVTQNSCG